MLLISILTLTGDDGSSLFSDLSEWVLMRLKACLCVGTGIGSEIGRKDGLGGLATGPQGCGDALIIGLYLEVD